jgi:hypothetical protein
MGTALVEGTEAVHDASLKPPFDALVRFLSDKPFDRGTRLFKVGARLLPARCEAWPSPHSLLNKEQRAHVAAQPHGATIGQRDDADARIDKAVLTADDRLAKINRGGANRGNHRFDGQQIVHRRRPQKVDFDAANRENNRIGGGELPLCEAARAQPFRSSSLEEPQVGSVVNAPRKVGVLVIDPDDELTVRVLGAVGFVLRRSHRHIAGENF